MTALWTDPGSGYDGAHCRVEPCSARPGPQQAPRPPVFFGGIASERVFADVIAHGDGWLPIEGFGWTIADIDRLRRRASESGRDPTSVRVVVYSATPDQAAADAYLEAGVDQIVYALPPNDFQHVDPALTAASAINQRLGN